MKNFSYYLALNRMNKVGPRTVMKLVERWPNLEEMFKQSAKQLEQFGLPAWLAHSISEFDLHTIDADFAWLNSSDNHHILTWDSIDYPKLLRQIPDPPVILYLKGNLSALNSIKIAIVGSRNPSITGQENARQFARDLSKQQIAIVSGLALGIDAQAHQGCLDGKGQTIAVLGTGIDRIYPRRHMNLAQQIEENGLLISELPLSSPPISGHFPRRNRIISGLSLCILVIEAAIKSGSLITARMAVEQNRDVMAIPGSIHNPLAQGCHYLIKQGAKLVTTVSDILDELGMMNPQENINDNPMISLASENENLVKFIGFEVTTIDQIIARSGYSVGQVTSELADLELNGTICSVPGGYIRCLYER